MIGLDFWFDSYLEDKNRWNLTIVDCDLKIHFYVEVRRMPDSQGLGEERLLKVEGRLLKVEVELCVFHE